MTARFLSLYGRPGDEALVVRGAGVTDGAGAAIVDIGPPPREHVWVVSRMRVFTAATLIQPSLVVYRLTPIDPLESPSTVIAGTSTGDADVADGEPELVATAEYLRFVWANCDPGVAVGVTVELVQRPEGSDAVL